MGAGTPETGAPQQGWGSRPARRVARRPGWWRGLLLGAVWAAALVAGFFFGGEPARGISWLAVAGLTTLVVLGDLLGPPQRLPVRLASVALTAGLFAAGWYLGVTELERAFDGCVARGEQVRQALAEHHRVHGSYPSSLEALALSDLPGGRLLRSGLLEYSLTDDGYLLEFADASSRLTADEERGFFERR
jgi:hypothetical protein